ncbi:lactose-binding lectin l-2-like [Sebastes umbrosus]|uniref:lactose-binding lectin l-2-like n=1 Tax=Sebastes umbrosus TaxID=72105 RepID=UPI0018A07B8B|nr:lactose-binding lectin l-2-like [Sebastes umbrosus]
MLLFLFLFGLALGAVSPSEELEVQLQRASCPTFWESFNNCCYKYVASVMNWADAELYCVSEGANLVSIRSLDEETFVKSLIKNFDPAERPTWTGLSDIHKQGAWMWSDGSAVNFTYWSPGEPNNKGGLEHCVDRNFGDELKWNDVPCSKTYASVCKSCTTCP